MIGLARDRSTALVTDGDALLFQSVISQSVANKGLTESVTDVTGFCIKRLIRARAHRKSYVFTCHNLSSVTLPQLAEKEYRRAMGDALTQKVTQGDAPKSECVTPKTLMQWGFTRKVTQVTQICREVPNARARVEELLQKCVTVRSASPLNWLNKEYRQ